MKNKKKIFLICFIIIIVLFLSLLTILYLNIKNIESDHEKISQILDEVMISAYPAQNFDKAISEIEKFKSVEEVWVSGETLFVKYKMGGQVSWIDTSGEID